MKYLVIGLLLVLLNSCGESAQNAEHDSISLQDTSFLVNPGDTLLTLSGGIDGIDSDFYVYSDDPDLIIPQDLRELHIVPYVEDDSSRIDNYMMVVYTNDFSYYTDVIGAFTGHVKVFYDGNKSHLAAEFYKENGFTEGVAKLYDTDGKLLVDRRYEAGNCTASLTDLYSIDWTFNPDMAQLVINDLEKHSENITDSSRTVKLGQSMIPSQGYHDNDLYEIIQKPVFDDIFTVNGAPFNGRLIGYFPPSSMDMKPYFDMEFKDGLLHGRIKIYNDWGELDLEEIFEQGAFVETVYKADYSEMDGVAKPVIYLYPDRDQAVHVSLQLKGHITHSYPSYPTGGWDVWACQNGTLYDKNKQTYYALFWEGQNQNDFTYSEGFVVKGSETVTFLEKSLDILGLTRREANEFIMYWLPQMENNPYNLIHFSSTEYEQMAVLKITPEPETLIRVMMVWSPLESPVEIPQQNLEDLAKNRSGFTVVEWGGKRQEYRPEFN